MTDRRLFAIPTLILAAILALGCDALRVQKPTPQPDTTVYGTLMGVESAPEQPEAKVLRIKVGMPRVLAGKRAEEGRPAVPKAEEGLIALAAVTPDTVAVFEGRPVPDLGRFKPGMDVVVLPSPGTTTLEGTQLLHVRAALVTDFASFRAWRLPKALPGDTATPPGDPGRINSPGVEHAPVPVRNGRVLYFSAHLRRPWKKDGEWIGARRPGLPVPTGDRPAVERTYRTELKGSGWTPPQPVVFPGLDDALTVRVSWMNDDETLCLVSVRGADGNRWVGRSERASAGKPWGGVERLKEAGEGSAEDAVFLAGSRTSFAFTTDRGGSLDIYLFYPKRSSEPQPLDPRIDTVGNEWAPRTGPKNELLFCRGDRQLLYVKGVARPMRIEAPLRIPVTEANPTRDGKWIFACLPHYTPLDMDQDIVVMHWLGPTKLGDPVPVDQWRPEAPAPTRRPGD